MKLQGTINKHDLVRYLAREYARYTKAELRYQRDGIEGAATLCEGKASICKYLIWDIMDNAI